MAISIASDDLMIHVFTLYDWGDCQLPPEIVNCIKGNREGQTISCMA